MNFDKEKFLTALKGLKESFSTAAKFANAKLQDGTIISYDGDTIEIGMPIMVMDTTGATLPIPDGDYTMEDGTTFTCVGGLVTAVTPSATPPAGTTGGDAGSAPAAMGESVSPSQAKTIVESVIRESRFAKEDALNELAEKVKEFITVKENFAAQKEAGEKEVTALKETIEKQGKTIQGLFELVEKLAEMPSATPAESKQKFSVNDWRKAFKEDLEKQKEQY